MYGIKASLVENEFADDITEVKLGAQLASFASEEQVSQENSTERDHQILLMHLANTQLNADVQREVLSLLEHPTIRHTVAFDIAANITSFIYLMDHMDAAALLLRTFDSQNISVKRVNRKFYVDDGEGAKAVVQRIHADPHQRIYLSRGTYESALLPLLRGTALLVVDFFPRGEEHMQATYSIYANIHNKFIGFFIKVITALVPGIIDQKIKKGLRVITKLEAAINRDPAQVYGMLKEAPEIDREAAETFQRLFLRKTS